MNELSRLLGLQGTLHLDEVDAPSLRGNPLGDPVRRPLAVYVPPGYDRDGSRRYPVLYWLPGFSGTVADAIAAGSWKRNVVQRADALVAEGRMPPAILVVVDGFTRLGGSQYVDSIHNGRYAQYVTGDVVGHVDAHYRTIAHEGGRAVAGKSSGGFGALHLVLAHPGVFGAAGSHSGDSAFRYASPPAFAPAQRTLESFDGDLAAFVTAFESANKPPQPWFFTIEMVAYAAAYSPRAAERWAIDLPWDARTGALRDDVFARWLEFDPCERVESGGAALSRLRLLYVDCGRRDEYALDLGARIFAARCREAGIAVEHQEFDDDHRNVGYRCDVSFPLLAGALDAG